MKLKRLWIGLGVLALLTPLGLLAAGSAWGEWDTEEIQKLLGYVPRGLARLSGLWKALMPDYGIPGWEGFFRSALGYLLSAALGVGLIAVAMLLIGKLITRRDQSAA